MTHYLIAEAEDTAEVAVPLSSRMERDLKVCTAQEAFENKHRILTKAIAVAIRTNSLAGTSFAISGLRSLISDGAPAIFYAGPLPIEPLLSFMDAQEKDSLQTAIEGGSCCLRGEYDLEVMAKFFAQNEPDLDIRLQGMNSLHRAIQAVRARDSGRIVIRSRSEFSAAFRYLTGIDRETVLSSLKTGRLVVRD